ncbi:carbohydrate ABC transporter permease [Maize bushy stunt phytoplasma]|nr:carbohydrate ABC transporter permease [Maize bushy stunt phytoplasma]
MSNSNNKTKLIFAKLKKHLPKVCATFTKYFFLSFFALFLAIPFYWMLNLALQDNPACPSFFPKDLTWNNFSFLFTRYSLFLTFFKTLTVVFISTVLGIFVSIITAFALSILEFRTKKIILGVFLITTMITTESMFLTNYQTVARLGFVDSGQGTRVFSGIYLAMILPFIINVFHIFLLMQNIKKIPKELYLSAKVDSSSDWKFLYKILTPLLRDNIINIIIFRAVATWNAYLWPELVGGKLLTNVIRNIFDSEKNQHLVNQQMAATVLMTLPLVLLFIFCKRYVLEGKLNSGIKG